LIEPGTWFSPQLAGTWFPDAFIGTMASVMRGLEGAPGAPETSVRDNLGTLRVALAAYQSMDEQRAIDPATL
jgi:predicted dehydrogenase